MPQTVSKNSPSTNVLPSTSRPSATKRAGITLRPLRLRYCRASELDLMAPAGGLRLRARYQDGDRGPFTAESQDHISVYEVTAAPAG